jgi:superfamily II DNA or RNA helicase
MQLRPYQVECRDAVLTGFADHDSTLVVMATGTGKTVVVADVARLWPDDRRILVLVHREGLLRQMLDTCVQVCGPTEVEAELGALYSHHGGNLFRPPKVVVASKDTLYKPNRLRRWGKDEVGLIVADEGHHCVPTNRTYADVLEYFRGYKLLGVTATADRLDGMALGSYFKSVAYVFDLLEATNRETGGWLVPIHQQLETVTGWDLSRVKVNAGDFSESALDRAMRQEKPLHALATAARKHACPAGRRKPCLIFTVSVAHAQLVADILNRWEPGSACALSGQSDPEVRARELRRFRRGEFQFLCGMNLFTEGFDEPSVAVVVIGRPTMSRALYTQMVGRGARPLTEIVPALNAAADAVERHRIIRASGKPNLLVVDLVGVGDRHKLITTADLLGGWYPEAVRREAVEVLQSWGGRGEVDEALKAARERLQAKESERRRGIILEARLAGREVDPFDLLDVRPVREPCVLRGRQCTEGQRRFLENYGVPVPRDLSFWKAKTLCDEVSKRRDEGHPTEKQARLLRKFGFDPSTMTFKEAKEAIDLLAASDWKLPS